MDAALASAKEKKEKKMTNRETVLLTDLPKELFTEIFSFLDPCDLILLSTCNKLFFDVATQEKLWKEARFLQMPIDDIEVHFDMSNYIPVLVKAKKLEELDLSLIILRNVEFLRHLVNLKHLSLYDCNVQDFTPLESLCRLEYLNLSFNPIDSSNVLHFTKYLPRLKVLHVSGISFSFIELMSLLSNCSSLTHASFSVNDDVTQELCKVVTDYFPGVKLHAHNQNFFYMV